VSDRAICLARAIRWLSCVPPGAKLTIFGGWRGSGGAARLEETLTTLAASEEAMHGAAGLSALDPANGETAKKFASTAANLEAMGASIDASRLLGFWLAFVSSGLGLGFRVWVSDLGF